MSTAQKQFIALLIAAALSSSAAVALGGMAASKAAGAEAKEAATSGMPVPTPEALIPPIWVLPVPAGDRGSRNSR